ncbi:MAG: MarR family transcriptional regulator [Candidatus Saccharibacteria bacterium]|nr:MarR family transcriptional regulator [Candidatus Saccharibacteria bacterium]
MSNEIFPKSKGLADITTYQVGALESAAHRALRQYKDKQLSAYGLTGMEWYIVGIVADTGKTGIRTTDLAKNLGTTLGFLTKALKLLEAKRIITRRANAEDARSSFVALNPSYQKQVKKIEEVLRSKLRDSIYSQITKEELETYIRVMEKLSKIDS